MKNFSGWKLSLTLAAVVAASAIQAGSAFRVTPYVQHPATNAMSVLWFSEQAGDATLSWWRADAAESQAKKVTVHGVEAPALKKTSDGTPTVAQYKYAHRLVNLAPDTLYNYRVTLAGEGGATYAKHFRTPPAAFRPIRFVAYSDSETQAKQKFGHWENPAFDHDDGKKAESDPRRYFVDKVEGFASNICAMVSRQPDFIVAAGDLAGMGSRQPDWDRYWDHNAGKFDDPAGAVPLLAAPGNHDYYGYGKAEEFGEMGIGKYLTYFEVEPNTAAVDDDQKCRFHRVDYGPVALIFIDPNNGPNYDPANTYDKWGNEYAKPNVRDTNQCMTDDKCRAPDFNPGSAQYKWIEEQLADAQKNKLFTFLVCHQCPYSVGYHGRWNGEKGLSGGDGEYLSGAATRCLTNLVFKYGVDGWICGHDEICEHSRLTGTEVLPDGSTANTEIHVYDVGFGGDDLRGARRTAEPNPHEVFRAHTGAPEVYENGLLVAGGKHYGHLEVNVTTNEIGQWICKLQQNYVFVSTNALGVKSFDLRTYPDVVVLTNTTHQAKETHLTLMQYNIHSGWGKDGQKWNLWDPIAVIKKVRPDVCTLNEVSWGGEAKGFQVDQPTIMGHILNPLWRTALGKAMTRSDGTEYGNAILYCEESLSQKVLALPTSSVNAYKEPRSFVAVEFPTHWVGTSHFPFGVEAQKKSVEIISKWAAEQKKPVFFTGDWNAEPNSPTIAAVREHFVILSDTSKFTFCTTRPHATIDYIAVDKAHADKVTVESYDVPHEVEGSDHFPLVMKLRIRK